jgi:transcriptional regulator with XRE-family HTH domain/quercetin dioxygenase-like cupin family protein
MRSQQTHRGHGIKTGRTKTGRAKAVPAHASRTPSTAPRKASEAAGPHLNGAVIGGKLRAERERQGITVREMARRVDVSPSLVSQIERGLVTPSVGTLWSMTAELGLVMDGLFTQAEHGVPAGQETALSRNGDETPARRAHSVVQRGHNRQHIRLAGGVEWERLTAGPDDQVEFLYVRYEAGAESCPENSFFRHGGKEYAYLLEGRLGLQIGFDRYELFPGDSVSFESHNPHRLWAIGDEPATAIWVIINRTNDNRQ